MKVVKETPGEVQIEYQINIFDDYMKAQDYGDELKEKGYKFVNSKCKMNEDGTPDYLMHIATYRKENSV